MGTYDGSKLRESVTAELAVSAHCQTAALSALWPGGRVDLHTPHSLQHHGHSVAHNADAIMAMKSIQCCAQERARWTVNTQNGHKAALQTAADYSRRLTLCMQFYISRTHSMCFGVAECERIQWR